MILHQAKIALRTREVVTMLTQGEEQEHAAISPVKSEGFYTVCIGARVAWHRHVKRSQHS